MYAGGSCPDGATCLGRGSINHRPNQIEVEDGYLRSLGEEVDGYFANVSPNPPRDIDADGVLDCWQGLTGNWSAPITSAFQEPRDKGPHKGIDIGASTGTPVYAAENGTVVSAYSGFAEGQKHWAGPLTRGNFVQINYESGKTARYLHLLPNLQVRLRDQVSVGEYLGDVNDTGASTRPHLHYDVGTNDQYLDPTQEYDC